jgi:hypothetical protein
VLMLWRYHRKVVLAVAATFAVVLLTLGVTAVVIQLRGGSAHQGPESRQSVGATRQTPVGGEPASPSSIGAGTTNSSLDVAYWDALQPVAPAVSGAYPAVPASVKADPILYARSFVTELFSQDYRAPRAGLLAWVQYESVPIVSNVLPPSDEAKGLVNSVTDPTWDDTATTVVPPVGQWLSLQAQNAYLTASNVQIAANAEWQAAVAAGHALSDPKMVLLDATLTTTLHTTVGGRSTTSQSRVSTRLMLGTATRSDGYGVMYLASYTVSAVN